MTTSNPRNRLAASTSPYLLQHASNPVDWWPWCDEAFAEARRRGVPVFLSIGYSTCHWCHVMERESFEDAATAKLMNERCVCIKLDREERPDLDELYMTATVLMTGHGGWPMSVFLDPASRRPYYCGTYFPPAPRGNTPSFQTVLRSMADAFTLQRAEVDDQARNLADAVLEHLGADAPGAALGVATIERCTQRVLAMQDAVHGGFGLAPKFPQPALCEFLLDVRPLADTTTAAAIDRALRSTLDAVALGGLHDHLAGGFHRYCVDAAWTVPHFEKMLIDQAQLLALYARAARDLGDPFYETIARQTAQFVGRELADPLGGFFSAIDADSAGKEGAAFVWTPEEVREAIADPADAAFAIQTFGLDDEPNFRDPHHPDDPPAWVLRLRAVPSDPQRLGRCAAQLLAARSRRPRPATDDKVIASWSASMLTALSRSALQPPGAYLDRLLLRLAPDGTLHRVARGRALHTPALLEDYAAIISACCAAGKIGEAIRLHETVRAHFTDAATGALFDTPAGATDLFLRACATHDGANPSAFSSMLHALLDLADATNDDGFARDAARALAAQSKRIADSPVGCVHSVRALLRLLRRYPAIARELETGDPGTPTPQPHESPPDPVRVYASADRLTISSDTPALITLRVEIQPGYAVASADPGDFGVPFRVDVTGGSGVAAYADYPPSRPVYAESFDLPVVIERTGPWAGTPLLNVRWQACRNQEPYVCLPPRTVELDIALDRG